MNYVILKNLKHKHGTNCENWFLSKKRVFHENYFSLVRVINSFKILRFLISY